MLGPLDWQFDVSVQVLLLFNGTDFLAKVPVVTVDPHPSRQGIQPRRRYVVVAVRKKAHPSRTSLVKEKSLKFTGAVAFANYAND